MGLDAGAQSADSQDEAIARLHKPQSTFVKISGHSGYFPWNHGKFICKGEGKWSCPGLRSYRSYGSEVTE